MTIDISSASYVTKLAGMVIWGDPLYDTYGRTYDLVICSVAVGDALGMQLSRC